MPYTFRVTVHDQEKPSEWQDLHVQAETWADAHQEARRVYFDRFGRTAGRTIVRRP